MQHCEQESHINNHLLATCRKFISTDMINRAKLPQVFEKLSYRSQLFAQRNFYSYIENIFS